MDWNVLVGVFKYKYLFKQVTINKNPSFSKRKCSFDYVNVTTSGQLM